MSKRSVASLALVYLLVATMAVEARDAARKLSRMVGFTIVSASTVMQVAQGKVGDKVVLLQDGTIFNVSFLLLDPLPLTDVIIFAKPPPQNIIDEFGGKVPREMLFLYKLLIDNEIYDATLVPK